MLALGATRWIVRSRRKMIFQLLDHEVEMNTAAKISEVSHKSAKIKSSKNKDQRTNRSPENSSHMSQG